MAIDANAMYRAGFGSKSTGRNVQVDERNARNAAITKTAFNVLGQAAIGQIKQNYRGLQEYRNASDSQTSLLNLKVDKMPASSGEYYVGENESLKGSILELKSLYDAAARKASFGIGKGRSKGRQDMTRYMKQLSDMNAVLEIYKTSREKAQSMMSVMTGGERQEGAKDISAGSDSVATGNTVSQANGDLGARLRWNIETGEMEVQVGGEWGVDKEGRKVYMDKAETGTYEEYVAENQEMNLKLKQKQLASQPEKPEPVMESRAQVDLAGNPIETPYEESETGKYAKESLSLTPNPPMSREDWTKLNQENRGLKSRQLYKKLKFAVEADGEMAETVRGINGDILKMSYKKDAVPWERVSEQYYGELQAKIGEYTDDQFKDYFFGGDTFDHSSGRMTESAPAYQLLLEGDKANKLVNEDGSYKNPELYGPGTADWEGRLLALKGQSFVKGSFYRKEATDRIFKNFETKYTENVEAYKTDNPVPYYVQRGYSTEAAMIKAEKEMNDDSGGFDQLNPFGSTDNDYVDDGSTKGKYLTGSTRNNKRRSVMNTVQNKPNAGAKYSGILGDYIWNGETWDLGEKSISTTEMMKDEKIFFPDGDFENNLTRKQVETKPLELSSLSNAKNVREVLSAIKSTYNNKNNAIKKSTGSIGGLSARKSGQSIYIMVDGVEKEFSLGSAGGFGGTSVNEGKRISYLTNLEALLNAVNSSLNPEYTNTDYNSTNNTETN
tara:strand:+ start:1302 stop:3476 length:2175 start_codon:yes stop_codon:yes gene_type:complete